MLKRWLENSPPWDIEEWTRGPIPSHIDYFGQHNYRPVGLVNSEKVWYAAKNYCCDGNEFHSGDVIVLDMETNRVWLASWDY